jgi:hypothetical protein
LDILFYITVPVFYIVGLITFAKWLSRGGGTADQHTRKTIAAELRARAAAETGAAQAALNEAAEVVVAGAPVKHPPVATSTLISPAAPTAPGAPDASAVPRPAQTVQVAGRSHPAPSAPNWTSLDIAAALHSLDNINLLLFLGAFLVVVSAGIFVGYNFSTLSGGFKTGFLALFATTFYVSGIVLYLRAPKLRPAGTTFTGIGLVLVPLVGLAAYNFTSAHDNGPAVWFVTSLATLVLYAFTLAATRQTYITYFMAFTTLSLFESSVSLFNLPVYWFGWGMGATAIVLATLARWRGWWTEAKDSLLLSANLFVPLSLLLTLFQSADNWPTPLGITFALAGMFYVFMSERFYNHRYGQYYWLAAVVSLPAALGLGLWNALGGPAIAVVLSGVAAAYLALDWLAAKQFDRHHRELLGVVGALLPVVSALLSTDSPGRLTLYLLIATAVSAVFSVRLREPALAFIAIMASLFVPYVALHQLLQPPLGYGAIAAAYLLLALALFGWRRFIGSWDHNSHTIGITGYLMALLVALVFAVADSSLALLLVGALVSAALYWASGYEHQPAFMYPASFVKYLAATQLVRLWDLPNGIYAVVIIVVGSISYGVGYYLSDQARGQALRYSAIMATLLGAAFGLSGDPLSPIASLALGGGLLIAEARRQGKPEIMEVGGGIIIVAFNWFMAHESVTNLQVHAWPWTLYFVYLAYRRRLRGHQVYDGYVSLALGIITLTIAGQALAPDGQLYGLELICIAVVLVFIGSALHYRLVKWWGAGTLILEVLYQIRDFLFALPKYLISAALGVALLAVAIVLLQRRREPK